MTHNSTAAIGWALFFLALVAVIAWVLLGQLPQYRKGGKR